MTRIIDNLDDIAAHYDALFCDLWGCVHNGIVPFEEAINALRQFRAKGGQVVLVTNAPRTAQAIKRQLNRIGLPRDTWDSIATSGDSARTALFDGVIGRNVYFIGTQLDQDFLSPQGLINPRVQINAVPLKQADGILCCGPFDALSPPSVYEAAFKQAISRGLKLLCANPDIVVDQGDTRLWCAGALAQLYTQMGGQSLYFGKPHAPIYALARQCLHSAIAPVLERRILCIGDGMLTDAQGAMHENLDCLFITGGLAARETKTAHQPDPAALRDFLQKSHCKPTYAIGALR